MNNTFNNINTSQSTIVGSPLKYQNNQEQPKTKKWIVIVIVIVILLLSIALVVLLLFRNNSSELSKKTVMMSLYEQLDDEMTYEELKKRIMDLAPEAVTSFDEGIYIVTIDGASDYISCMEKTEENAQAMKDYYESDTINTYDEEKLGAILTQTMEESDESLDEDEDDEENDVTTNATTTLIEPSTIMSYFVYYLYDEDSNEEDNMDFKEYSIEKNVGRDEYGLNDGNSVVWFRTKADALKALDERTFR